MKGVLPRMAGWLVGTRDFGPVLAALLGPVQKIFFLTVHFFASFVPIAQQAGQAVVPVHLSLLHTSSPTESSMSSGVMLQTHSLYHWGYMT
jgi:hypothetical protein